jgi:hypothetical protein
MALIRQLTIGAVLLLIAGEAKAIILQLTDGPWNEYSYTGFHLIQMVLVIGISFMIRKEVISALPGEGEKSGRWAYVPALVLAGLVFSFIGDLINSALIDLTFILKPQTMLSIPFFTIAHIFYVIAFYFLSCRPGEDNSVTRKQMTVGLVIWPFLGIGLWLLVIPREADGLIKHLSLFYALVVTLMAMASLWPFHAFGKRALFVPIGGMLFALSDSIIGYTLLRPGGFYFDVVIWTMYFTAQLFILHSPLVIKPVMAVDD